MGDSTTSPPPRVQKQFWLQTLPLGFTNNMMSVVQTRPATERRFLWSFAGFKRAARVDMFKNFKTVEAYKCYLFDRRNQRPLLGRAEFRALLSNSVFAPCPMGNTVLESFRIPAAPAVGYPRRRRLQTEIEFGGTSPALRRLP
jgi:hypothetical protein